MGFIQSVCLERIDVVVNQIIGDDHEANIIETNIRFGIELKAFSVGFGKDNFDATVFLDIYPEYIGTWNRGLLSGSRYYQLINNEVGKLPIKLFAEKHCKGHYPPSLFSLEIFTWN